MSASSWRPFPAADPWPEVSGRCLDHARAVQAAEPLSWMSPAEIALHILRRRHQEPGTKRQRLPDLVQQPSYTTKRKHLACYDNTYLRCFSGLERSVIWNESARIAINTRAYAYKHHSISIVKNLFLVLFIQVQKMIILYLLWLLE